jgi:hypothetical protein
MPSRSVDRIRIEVGFDGGQIMSALVEAAAAEQIERALTAGSEKSLSFEAEDGRYTIALARVVYLKRFAREARVGFGS